MGICDRGRVGELLAESIGKPCDEVTLEDLAAVKNLWFENKEIEAFGQC